MKLSDAEIARAKAATALLSHKAVAKIFGVHTNSITAWMQDIGRPGIEPDPSIVPAIKKLLRGE